MSGRPCADTGYGHICYDCGNGAINPPNCWSCGAPVHCSECGQAGIVCALCDHPQDEHFTGPDTGCGHVIYSKAVTLCDCPGFEAPSNEDGWP